MITKVKLVQLHEPLFLAGVNFGNKLQPKSGKGELTLTHDTESDHVLVEFSGERAHIKNWASFNEDTGIVVKPTAPAVTILPVTKTQVSGPGGGLKISAQIEDPTRQAPKTILRKAKYQGQETQGE